MSYFKIEINGKKERIVGSKNCTTLTLQLVSGLDHPDPTILANEYHREGKKLKSCYSWTFEKLTDNSYININILKNANADTPDKIDQRRGRFVKDEKLFVKEQIDRLKRMNKARKIRTTVLREEIEESEMFCGFCGKLQSEVDILFSGPMVDICNECIILHSEVLNNERQPYNLLLLEMPKDRTPQSSDVIFERR